MAGHQPFDEAYEIEDHEEIASTYTASPGARSEGLPSRGMDRDDSPGNSPPEHSDDESSGYDVQRNLATRQHIDVRRSSGRANDSMDRPGKDDGSDTASESMESSSEESHVEPRMEGAYDPKEYESLAVTPDIKELFNLIGRYEPQTQTLETRLKPFIPEYIPCVGDIDAFIKIPRPDGMATALGLDVVDEPSASQSDPTILDIHLRQLDKSAVTKAVAVKMIEKAEDTPRAIDNWVKSMTELHRQRPPQTVHYAQRMPEVETLMQEWPHEVEEMLAEAQLPGADLAVPLQDYVDIVCALLDIPVYKSRVQSLHLLFTLYSEFKSSQHFKSLEEKKNQEAESVQLG